MGDLIEKDKIYEAVYDLACKSVGVIGGISEDYACGLREAAHMIEEAPAVDAVPVVRKHCDFCGRGRPIKAFTILPDIGMQYGPSIMATYCPNCGAKMEGEGDAE